MAFGRSLVSEHKNTRVPGDPRDLVDCYLDELDKVCVCVNLQFILDLNNGLILNLIIF